MPQTNLSLPRTEIIDFCRRHHIRKLALFGSVLRDDFGPDSDVDVLVEFEPGHTPGFDFIEIQDELSTLFGRPVDLVTFQSVEQSRNCIRRRHILSSQQTIYVA